MGDRNRHAGKSAFSDGLPEDVEGARKLCGLLVAGRCGKVRGGMWSLRDDRVIAKFLYRVKIGELARSGERLGNPETTKDTKVFALCYKWHPLLEFLERVSANCVKSEYPDSQDKFVLGKARGVEEVYAADSSRAGARSG